MGPGPNSSHASITRLINCSACLRGSIASEAKLSRRLKISLDAGFTIHDATSPVLASAKSCCPMPSRASGLVPMWLRDVRVMSEVHRHYESCDARTIDQGDLQGTSSCANGCAVRTDGRLTSLALSPDPMRESHQSADPAVGTRTCAGEKSLTRVEPRWERPYKVAPFFHTH